MIACVCCGVAGFVLSVVGGGKVTARQTCRLSANVVLVQCSGTYRQDWGSLLVLKEVLHDEGRAMKRVQLCPGVVPHCVLRYKAGSEMLVMPCLVPVSDMCGKLSDAQRVVMARSASVALRQVHGAGVLHCDIKPHNMFLVDEKDPSTVRIGDFGSAHLDFSGQENEKWYFTGTRAFCFSSQHPPSEERDFRSLCLSLFWLRFPWKCSEDMPSWEEVVSDAGAAEAWSAFNSPGEST
jgi:serine/threonine protein kinase